MTTKPLTAKRELFAQLVADIERPRSLTEAYREAFEPSADADPNNVSKTASALFREREVRARIDELKQEQLAGWLFKQVDVLRELTLIATADPAELIRPRRFCCRHCYGEGHAYQWTDEIEFAKALDDAMRSNEGRKRDALPLPLPTCDGGFGYDRNRKPHARCPQCHGDGYQDVHITTPDEWSPGARKLYAGIKTTKDGVQVLMRDQDGALRTIAQHLGMLITKSEVSGPGGGPIPTLSTTLVGDLPPDEAMKVYQASMG